MGNETTVKEAQHDRAFEFRSQGEVELVNGGRIRKPGSVHFAPQLVFLTRPDSFPRHCERLRREKPPNSLTLSLRITPAPPPKTPAPPQNRRSRPLAPVHTAQSSAGSYPLDVCDRVPVHSY